ncbi:hydroxymethylpyrimidine pyrophosphatase-like HAD family hydrolase, partial [Rhizobium sp. BK060]|nr:hydroxymethylpyrimidine pyrophosphatase-like HAD family hydrolase [Rhizobium sp. BK060]
MTTMSALFSDVDGTLLTGDYALPQTIVEAFALLRRKSIRPVVATARSPKGVAAVCSALSVEYAVCFNGGWVGRPLHGETLASQTIPRQIALMAMSEARRLGLSAMWYTADGIFTDRKTPLSEREAIITGESIHQASVQGDLPEEPFKIMCVKDGADETGFDVTDRLLPRRFRFEAGDQLLVVDKAVEEVVPFV